jgi:uncharacterized integral membrane protein
MHGGEAEVPAPGPGTPQKTPAPAPAPERGSEKVGPTRLSGAWTAAVVAIVLVVAMLIFILQNGREVPISFVSAHGHLPLGVAMLFSAVVGAVIVVGCGAARILQLRRVAKRRSRPPAPAPVMAPVLAPVPPPAGPAVPTLPPAAEPPPPA